MKNRANTSQALTPLLTPESQNLAFFFVGPRSPWGLRRSLLGLWVGCCFLLVGEPVKAEVIRLNLRGTRGVVPFDHKTHETRINQDPDARYKARPGAACAGCHHTANPNGTPQLWKCTACHRGEGHSGNPKNGDFDEAWSKRAFHDACIACHRASARGPTTCGGCHKSIYEAEPPGH